MLAASSTSALGVETVYPVHHHETVYVKGGGGGIQTVPWNLPPDGRVHFGGLGALTEDDKNSLAIRVRTAAAATQGSGTDTDLVNIIAAIPTTDRQDVIARAIATADSSLTTIIQRAAAKVDPAISPALRVAWGIASTASFAASVYHGYRRNNSIGWAIWWGIMGALFPIITPTIAVAQGFAQPKHSGGFGRSRYRRRARRAPKRYRRRA